MDRILPKSVDSAIGKGTEYIYSFRKYAEPTVIFVSPVVERHVKSLADSIGFDTETLKFTLALFLCYPLGMVMLALPYGKLKHFFSFILGVFLLQFTIGVQWIHQLVTSLVVYIMFLVLPSRAAKIVVPAFVMIYMTLGHLHRQYVNYLGWDMDFTSSQMVLTMKLYSLAYNLYDGNVLARGVESNRASKKCAAYAVTKLPHIVEYLGYTFCFANVLAGPAYEYRYYAAACDGSNLYGKDTDDLRGKMKKRVPSNIWPTLKPFLISLVCLGAFVLGTGKFSILDPTDPQHATPALLTPEFLSKPWIQMYGLTWIALFFIRQKYYFVWKNAEGANNIWYAGFEGYDDMGKELGWEISNNADILEFETAPNVKSLTAAWNKKTANWLSRYVYIRTGGSLIMTYGLSAFWHGFYPGYYLFFMSVPLLTTCERLGRKKLSPHFVVGTDKVTGKTKYTVWYDLGCRFFTSLLVEYMVLPFQLLSFDWAIACWRSHFFFGHILCLVFFMVVSNMKTPKLKKV